MNSGRTIHEVLAVLREEMNRTRKAIEALEALETQPATGTDWLPPKNRVGRHGKPWTREEREKASARMQAYWKQRREETAKEREALRERLTQENAASDETIQ